MRLIEWLTDITPPLSSLCTPYCVSCAFCLLAMQPLLYLLYLYLYLRSWFDSVTRHYHLSTSVSVRNHSPSSSPLVVHLGCILLAYSKGLEISQCCALTSTSTSRHPIGAAKYGPNGRQRLSYMGWTRPRSAPLANPKHLLRQADPPTGSS